MAEATAVAEAQPTTNDPVDKTDEENLPVDESAEDDASAQAETEEEPETKPSVEFRGSQRNFIPGAALLLASVLAFTMGMTDVFFAEAVAWTIAAWGLMLILVGAADVTEVYEVTDDALLIRNPLRPWAANKEWYWYYIRQLDVVIKRKDARPQDVELQIFYQPEGELGIEREDRVYDAELARLVIAYAGLSPASADNPTDLHNLPTGSKETYTWS